MHRNENDERSLGRPNPAPRGATPRPLTSALGALREVLRFDLVVLFELDDQGLRLELAHGALPSDWSGARVNLDGLPNVKRLLEERRGLVVDVTPATTPSDLLDAAVIEFGSRSRLLVPLFSAQRSLGVLCFERHDGVGYSEESARLASVFGQVFAQALELLRSGHRVEEEPSTAQPLPTFTENERSYFERVLSSTAGKLHGADGAAALVGLKPTTLQSRLKKLGIEPRRWKKRVNGASGARR